MSKTKHKKERAIAWILTLVAFLLIATVGFMLFCLVKDPIAEKIAKLKGDDLKEVVAEEVEEAVEEEFEEDPVVEEAISEEDLEELFAEEEEEEPVVEEVTEDDLLLEEAQEIVDAMDMNQMVGQLFFITPEMLTGVDTATAAGDMTKEALTEYPVGGIIMFAKNIEDPEQLKTMTGNIQKYSEEIISLPMFIGVDEEGGSVTRIASNEAFSVTDPGDMKSIGDEGDTQKAYDAGNTIGTYLNEYGFNIDFAPDADVLNENTGDVIGDRSFGEDPQVVANMSINYLNGLRDANVFGCPKHFPGHGSTSLDTHTGAASTEKDWAELSESDIIPFKSLIEDDAKFIMVGHVSVPELTGDDIPASLSGIIITEKLRSELGYKGIVITDAMQMSAITDKYKGSEAVIESLKAGADMILMPSDFKDAYAAVIKAVEDGSLTEERIKESAVRIVKTKLLLQNTKNNEEY